MGRNTENLEYGSKPYTSVCLECAKEGKRSLVNDMTIAHVLTRISSGNTPCGHSEQNTRDKFMFIDHYKKSNKYPDLDSLEPIE